MTNSERRFDVDWLRVIAIGLLIIYHVAIAFQPWGVFIGFIQNNESMQWIWTPMSMLNIWRIPLLFYVSGMGVYFAIQRRNWLQLLKERSRRILLPYVFGIVAIVPLQIVLWQQYYQQDLRYSANPAHLWFLGNIFCYVLFFIPILILLKKISGNRIHTAMKKVFSTPLGLLVIMIPFVLEAELIRPENFEMYAMTAHGFWLGMIAFFTGIICVYSASFWTTVKDWKWLLLILALGTYLVRVNLFGLRTPDFAMAIESNLWIFSLFGFGYTYLNKPSQKLSYLSEAAYPVYIIHMFFLMLGSWLLFELDVHVIIKFVLLVLFTFAGCMLSYEFIIKRAGWIRPLFGLKP